VWDLVKGCKGWMDHGSVKGSVFALE
jgi:hypothetical protein